MYSWGPDKKIKKDNGFSVNEKFKEVYGSLSRKRVCLSSDYYVAEAKVMNCELKKRA